MKKLIASVLLCSVLSSCIVSTAAKVVKTTAKVAVGTVKVAAKGTGWVIQKANGKINEDRLNGKWKVVGFYRGTFDEFSATENPENLFTCTSGDEIYEFKMNKEKMWHYDCGSSDGQKFKIKYSFEKNDETKSKENMVTYGPGYFTIINVTGDTLVLEGYFAQDNGNKIKSICTLEKTR